MVCSCPFLVFKNTHFSQNRNRSIESKVCPGLHMCSIRTASTGRGHYPELSRTRSALSKCYNGEPRSCQCSNAKSSAQLNPALKKTKQYEKPALSLQPASQEIRQQQMTAATGLEEHPGKVSLGDFPCHGLGLSIQFVCMLAAQLNLQDSGFLGCKQEQ